MNGSTMDVLIDHDRMKTLLELPENATEQDVLDTVLTIGYDNLKWLLASTSKHSAAGVSLSGRVSSIFASGGEASDTEASTGDAKSAAEQSSNGSSSKGDEASGSDFNAR